MNAWCYEPETQSTTYPEAKVRLRAVRPTGLSELAPFALIEWADYRLVAAPEMAERLGVWVNRQPVARDADGPFWPIGFQNQVGKSTIQVRLDGRALPPLTVEVLSNKFPTPAEHLAFYRALLNALDRQSYRLPFAFEAPTGHTVEETPQPPSPVFVYHFLQQHQAALAEALEIVRHAPHRLLCEEESLVPLAHVTTADSATLVWVVGHPQEWVKAPHLAVARRLQGNAPARVSQWLAEETADTAPNRFVRHFVRELAQWIAHPDLARFGGRLAAIRSALEQTLLDPVFEEVGEMHRFPAESQVLLRRDGYRELAQLWRLFHLARRPFFGPLQEAIDSRDIATLYEFWCFFALVEQLEPLLGAARLGMRISDVRGLEHQATARFAAAPWRLVYNRSFTRSPGPAGSYSVTLRPDMVLMHDSRPEVVFDAKFRFQAMDLRLENDDSDEADPERIAKRADLYKMHTYRDALAVRAAVALYPGNEAVFYDADTHAKRAVQLEEMIIPGGCRGIGALPFSPV